jgi:hypothetical protein
MNNPFRTFSTIPLCFYVGAEWVIHSIAEKSWFILCLSTSGALFTGYSQFIYPRNNYFHPLCFAMFEPHSSMFSGDLGHSLVTAHHAVTRQLAPSLIVIRVSQNGADSCHKGFPAVILGLSCAVNSFKFFIRSKLL